jgi:hypothetical protein
MLIDRHKRIKLADPCLNAQTPFISFNITQNYISCYRQGPYVYFAVFAISLLPPLTLLQNAKAHYWSCHVIFVLCTCFVFKKGRTSAPGQINNPMIDPAMSTIHGPRQISSEIGEFMMMNSGNER